MAGGGLRAAKGYQLPLRLSEPHFLRGASELPGPQKHQKQPTVQQEIVWVWLKRRCSVKPQVVGSIFLYFLGFVGCRVVFELWPSYWVMDVGVGQAITNVGPIPLPFWWPVMWLGMKVRDPNLPTCWRFIGLVEGNSGVLIHDFFDPLRIPLRRSSC